jgi:hypothetical protein
MIPIRIVGSSLTERTSLLALEKYYEGYGRPEKHLQQLLLREAHVSLELLNPGPDCHTRRSTAVSTMFNSAATVRGGGVLSLPLAFSRTGILPMTFLMIYAAVITDFSLHLLVACARRSGGRY